MRNFIPVIIFVVLVAIAGIAMMLPKADKQTSMPLPDFTVSGLSAKDLPQTGTYILNLFASWCVPCEAEHPVLIKLGETVPVYGVAFMNKKDDVEAFLTRLGDPFRKWGYDEKGAASIVLGIRGVPTTLVIRDGQIIYRHEQPLLDSHVETIIKPLLAEPKS